MKKAKNKRERQRARGNTDDINILCRNNLVFLPSRFPGLGVMQYQQKCDTTKRRLSYILFADSPFNHVISEDINSKLSIMLR